MAGGKGEGASAASAVCGGGGSGDSRWSHAGPAKRRRRSRARQRSRPLHRPCCFDSHKSTAAGARLAPTVVDGRGRGGGGIGPRQARGCASASRPRGGGASLHDSLPLPPTLSPLSPLSLSLRPFPDHTRRAPLPHARGTARPRERLLLHQAVGAGRPSTTRSLALRRRHGMGREGSGGAGGLGSNPRVGPPYRPPRAGAETVEAASRRSVAKQNKVWVAQPRLRLSRQGLPPQAI